MNKILTFASPLLVALLLAGCATTDEKTMQLQAENDSLKKDVAGKAQQIQFLTGEKARLSSELDYSTKRDEVLAKEKAARMEEASVTRKGVRDFTDHVMKTLQDYFSRAEIVDYLGNELLARGKTDSAKNVLLVDLANPTRENGTIIGGRAYVSGPCKISFCLLRPNAGKYDVVAMTPELAATAAGAQNWVFDLPMAARKGDLIGTYFSEDVCIPYDDFDTGHVVPVPGTAKLNSSVTVVPGDARGKRTYSFGVVGYFDTAAVQNSTIETIPAAGK
jgi:outer membrane murein-binding lipoprotein Lpp